MWEKRGDLPPCGGASPLPRDPVSQYSCKNFPKTDDNDRIHKNDANTLS